MKLDQRLIALIAAVVLFGGGWVLKNVNIGPTPAPGPDGKPAPVITDEEVTWAVSPPKMLIVQNTEDQTPNIGAAINSTLWRIPFEDLGGDLVILDPTDDDGQPADIKDQPKWVASALRKVPTDEKRLPYFVYAYRGSIRRGTIPDSEDGAVAFVNKIISFLESK